MTDFDDASAFPGPEPTDPPSPPSSPPADIEEAAALVGRIGDEIRRTIVGQRDEVEQVLLALIAGGHVLIEGVPGLGKTLLVLALARTFGGRFSRVQFTPDLMPSDVTGHVVFDSETNSFRLRKGPAFTNLLLADEVNRAPAKTQAALLEVMQEGQITIEGETAQLVPPFMALATQNPIEQEGTYPLPEAQLDRFLLKVLIDYPDQNEENAIVKHVTHDRVGDALDASVTNRVAEGADITRLQSIASTLTVDERVIDYAVRIVRATRERRGVAIGAGPRGAIALIRIGRARALMDGRSFVIPDDVKALALPALRHRIALAPELELEGTTPDELLTAVLAQVDVPRE